MNIPDDVYDRELVATRRFNASRQALWQAWSDPEPLGRWFGPHGFRTTTHQHAFREGGRWELTLHGPDGTDYPNVFVYRRIDPMRRITLEHSGLPKFLLTAEFEVMGDTTKLTFRQLFDTEATCAAVQSVCAPANEENLDRLADVLRT